MSSLNAATKSSDSEISQVSHTPMMKQYLETKAQYPDTILFYRIGDFYEMFYEDAVTAARVLDIVLTSRNKNDPNPIPLCGIPHHSMQPYLAKLVEKGYKVAICDQVEDPKDAKGMVRREVTRVVTPGLANFLESTDAAASKSAHYVMGLFKGRDSWGVALLDIATGDFRVTQIGADELEVRSELERVSPSEILLPEGLDIEFLKLRAGSCVSRLPAWVWEETYARRILYEQFRVATLSGFSCEDIPQAVIAAGGVLHYVRETQKVSAIPHLTALMRYERTEAMIVDEECRRNLSLDELLGLMDRTKTAMGYRRLREWFYAPLLQKDAIEKRLDAVEELLKHPHLVTPLQKELEKVYDLERINSRLSLGNAHARDLRALVQSLEAMSKIRPSLEGLQCEELKSVIEAWEDFTELKDDMDRSLVDDPPFSIREGELIREGMYPDLDELKSLRRDAKTSIAAIEDRERKRTGINSMKIQFNRVFGYYLEVSAAHLSKVPPDYIRKQTLTNAERFITQELKQFEDKVLGADEKIKALEYQIFCELRERVLKKVPDLQRQAGCVAFLDALLCLVLYARDHRTVRPQIEESGVLLLKGARHPVIEAMLSSGSYVPNDLSMDIEGDRLLMITGPNMAGKSTVIRQAGLFILMAQAGCFVPAAEARIGLVDRVFTRVGASDRLSRGESTFMVEMAETAAILHQATEKSLILLDEIGRGTSTFDGISIAWAVAEYLHDTLKARTLFATHYHELIELEKTCPGIKNYNVQIQEENGKVVFLYRLVRGGMSHSYGIHVARLAGLPGSVVERAQEVLKNLEDINQSPKPEAPQLAKKRPKRDENQTTLF